MVALGRLKAGCSTTGGIKGFFLKRGMFGGDKMVVHFKFQFEQPLLSISSSDVTSCNEAKMIASPSRTGFAAEL